MVEAPQVGKRGFQSHFLTVAPATVYSSPKAALSCLRALLGKASSQQQQSRAYRVVWPEPSVQASGLPGIKLKPKPHRSQTPSWARHWGRGGPPCTAPQSTCSKLSRAPFLFAPCPWPKMNKTPGVGGAIHGTRECVSRPAASSH